MMARELSLILNGKEKCMFHTLTHLQNKVMY